MNLLEVFGVLFLIFLGLGFVFVLGTVLYMASGGDEV